FEIERLGDVGLEARNVVVADVSAILAQMRGDAVGAGLDRDLRRMHGIRVPPAAGVADGGGVVDIDADTNVGSRDFLQPIVSPATYLPTVEAELLGLSRSAAGNVTSSIHPLGVRHHVLRPQLRDNRVEVLEVEDLEIDGHRGKVRR